MKIHSLLSQFLVLSVPSERFMALQWCPSHANAAAPWRSSHAPREGQARTARHLAMSPGAEGGGVLLICAQSDPIITHNVVKQPPPPHRGPPRSPAKNLGVCCRLPARILQSAHKSSKRSGV
jgi:hypothetical protein